MVRLGAVGYYDSGCVEIGRGNKAPRPCGRKLDDVSEEIRQLRERIGAIDFDVVVDLRELRENG